MENKTIITISAKNQRAIARKSIEGQWKNVIFATLIYYLAISIPPLLLEVIFYGNKAVSSTVGLIYMLLTVGAFTIGYSAFILQIFRKENPSPGEIFSGFSNVFRGIRVFMTMILMIWIWCIPAVVAISYSALLLSSLFSFFLIIVGILLLALPIKVAIDYSQVFFICVDNDKMPVMQMLSYSKYLMKGNRWKLVCVEFSFIGWTLLANLPTIFMSIVAGRNTLEPTEYLLYNLAGLILSAGYLWITPYITTTMAGFYEIISGQVKIKLVNDIRLSSDDTVELEQGDESSAVELEQGYESSAVELEQGDESIEIKSAIEEDKESLEIKDDRD